MKRIALVLVGIVVGMSLNSSPTQAAKDEQAALLCQRWKKAGGSSWRETWSERAKPSREGRDAMADHAAVIMAVVERTFCD